MSSTSQGSSCPDAGAWCEPARAGETPSLTAHISPGTVRVAPWIGMFASVDSAKRGSLIHSSVSGAPWSR